MVISVRVPERGVFTSPVRTEQFELLEFVFDSVYVDLQYDEISLYSGIGKRVGL